MSKNTIKLERTVKKYTMRDYSRSLEFIGERRGGAMTNFYVGAYGFSNPYSANMYAYLFRKCGPTVAKETVKEFEKKLHQSNAKKFVKFVKIDWVGLVSGSVTKVTKLIDWKGIIVDLAMKAAGSMVRSGHLNQALAQYNHYNPKSDREQYVLYAIAYMARNPSKGPAYQLLSDTVRPKRAA